VALQSVWIDVTVLRSPDRAIATDSKFASSPGWVLLGSITDIQLGLKAGNAALKYSSTSARPRDLGHPAVVC